jgi:hypothetical protein
MNGWSMRTQHQWYINGSGAAGRGWTLQINMNGHIMYGGEYFTIGLLREIAKMLQFVVRLRMMVQRGGANEGC